MFPTSSQARIEEQGQLIHRIDENNMHVFGVHFLNEIDVGIQGDRAWLFAQKLNSLEYLLKNLTYNRKSTHRFVLCLR